MVVYLIQMISQGTDGCSSGFLLEGVVACNNMLNLDDLGKDAMECHPSLLG